MLEAKFFFFFFFFGDLFDPEICSPWSDGGQEEENPQLSHWTGRGPHDKTTGGKQIFEQRPNPETPEKNCVCNALGKTDNACSGWIPTWTFKMFGFTRMSSFDMICSRIRCGWFTSVSVPLACEFTRCCVRQLLRGASHRYSCPILFISVGSRLCVYLTQARFQNIGHNVTVWKERDVWQWFSFHLLKVCFHRGKGSFACLRDAWASNVFFVQILSVSGRCWFLALSSYVFRGRVLRALDGGVSYARSHDLKFFNEKQLCGWQWKNSKRRIFCPLQNFLTTF